MTRFHHQTLARAVIGFWFASTSREHWFRKSEAFDMEIRRRFGAAHVAAASGHLDAMRASPEGALALLILLDQFSRNLNRGSALAFAQDQRALLVAREALRRRFDMIADAPRRAFFYLPFMHAEDLAEQQHSVSLYKARLAASSNIPFAIEHYEIIARFGRFPHRNRVLGRETTPQEDMFLRRGGFAG